VRLAAIGRATTVTVVVAETDDLASLAAVSVHVPGIEGAVQVVFAPLPVIAGLKDPQVAVQSTVVSTAFETDA
jgi:uncharacterized membrane protein YbhN (UPF0104 family)